MTTSYSQIVRQIENLKRQAEVVRSKEVAGVISRMKDAIAFYQLTARDLGLAAAGATRPAAKTGTTRAVKFADDAGNTWGGRGPRPAWLSAALSDGHALEEFAVGGAKAATPKKAAAKKRRSPAKGRPVAAKYRDENGNTWAGRGLKPRWFKDALAAGKTVESMLI